MIGTYLSFKDAHNAAWNAMSALPGEEINETDTGDGIYVHIGDGYEHGRGYGYVDVPDTMQIEEVSVNLPGSVPINKELVEYLKEREAVGREGKKAKKRQKKPEKQQRIGIGGKILTGHVGGKGNKKKQGCGLKTCKGGCLDCVKDGIYDSEYQAEAITGKKLGHNTYHPRFF